MHRDGWTIYAKFSRLCGTVGAIAVFIAIPVRAVPPEPVNLYTFNDGTANDSKGGQNGTLVDPSGIAHYVGGAVDLTGNNGAGSNQDFTLPATSGAFVDLPNGVFTSAVNSGAGQASLEVWFTIQQNRTWAEVYSFGKSDGAEGVSSGAGGSDYVTLIPSSGVAVPDFRGTTHSAAGVETPLIGSPAPLPTGVREHVIITFDQFDSSGGPNGTAKLYLNNGAPVAGGIEPDIANMSDINNYLGRSQWPDPLFDGTIDQFAIYNKALTAADVSTLFTTGPVPSPTPTLVINRDTGAITVANQSTQSLKIKAYTLASTAGAFNPATWTSIDADNTFDPDGTWTKQTQTNVQLTESVTGGTLDGGTLAVSASRGVGTPWRKSPFEDVTFNYTLSDGTTALGTVQYTGHGAALAQGDLNGDGAINVADWTIFLTNAFTKFPTETAVGAYLKGDLNGDKANDYADFLLFKNDYIAANGLAAFRALGATIPEPTTVALATITATALVTARRRICKIA